MFKHVIAHIAIVGALLCAMPASATGVTVEIAQSDTRSHTLQKITVKLNDYVVIKNNTGVTVSCTVDNDVLLKDFTTQKGIVIAYPAVAQYFQVISSSKATTNIDCGYKIIQVMIKR